MILSLVDEAKFWIYARAGFMADCDSIVCLVSLEDLVVKGR
jgi:hypothetical protein